VAGRQNQQLFALVDAIVGLKAQYGLGEVRVHTVLDFDETQLETCGVLCSSVFYPWKTKEVRPGARWLLEQLAAHGGVASSTRRISAPSTSASSPGSRRSTPAAAELRATFAEHAPSALRLRK
jgi:hypothetical protein